MPGQVPVYPAQKKVTSLFLEMRECFRNWEFFSG
jgi:hypothetical protein